MIPASHARADVYPAHSQRSPDGTDQTGDVQQAVSGIGVSGAVAAPHEAVPPLNPTGWPAEIESYWAANCEYAKQRFDNWTRFAFYAAQRDAECLNDLAGAFAGWFAWWQVLYGIPLAVAPFSGMLNAGNWAVQDALPFAAVA